MGRDEALLAAGLSCCAALVVGAMALPARGAARTVNAEPEPEPAAEVQAPKLPRALRAHLLPDGGPGTVDARTKVLVGFGWGQSKAQLGRARPRDAQPEAPMSVAADAAGNPWVLDQVNGRIVRLGGEPPIALPVRKARDLAVAKNGNAVVVTDGSLTVLAPDGQRVAEWRLDLSPQGVFTFADEVYVGLEGGAAMRLGTADGEEDHQRPEVPGRPSRDGRTWVNATIADGAHGRVVVMGFDRDSRERRFIREIGFGMPVLELMLVDTDAAGVIYLAALGERVPGGGYLGEGVAALDLMCLEPTDGRPLSRTELPANPSADETYRELAALPSGGVVYLYRSESGAELRRVDCR